MQTEDSDSPPLVSASHLDFTHGTESSEDGYRPQIHQCVNLIQLLDFLTRRCAFSNTGDSWAGRSRSQVQCANVQHLTFKGVLMYVSIGEFHVSLFKKCKHGQAWLALAMQTSIEVS